MTGMSDAEFEPLWRALIAEIDAGFDDERRDIEHAEHELDEAAVAVLVAALDAAGGAAVPVQVVPAPTDVHYSYDTYHRVLGRDGGTCSSGWACPDRRGGCDLGRVGVIREYPRQAPAGNWHAYIEDMGPGDDGCPSRYLAPRHIAVTENN